MGILASVGHLRCCRAGGQEAKGERIEGAGQRDFVASAPGGVTQQMAEC